MRMSGLKLYITPGTSLDAVDFYLKIVESAAASLGIPTKRVTSIKEIAKNDIVFAVEAKSALLLRLLFRNTIKIICWYQGAIPEEALLMKNSKFRKFYWEYFERIALSIMDYSVFVSEAMKTHYQKKYGYNKQNYIIIPCYNKLLNPSINYTKYNQFNFVYAGNLAAWQCVEPTLEVYKYFEEQQPDSTLTFLTADKTRATELFAKHGIKHGTVKYVALDDLDEELAKYSYGFIIRDNIVVNNVATPTKMNSYLANGVIPIYSDVVVDFKKVFKDKKCCLPLNGESNANLLERLKQIPTLDSKLIEEDIKSIFHTYYNREVHVQMMVKVLKALE